MPVGRINPKNIHLNILRHFSDQINSRTEEIEIGYKTNQIYICIFNVLYQQNLYQISRVDLAQRAPYTKITVHAPNTNCVQKSSSHFAMSSHMNKFRIVQVICTTRTSRTPKHSKLHDIFFTQLIPATDINQLGT